MGAAAINQSAQNGSCKYEKVINRHVVQCWLSINAKVSRLHLDPGSEPVGAKLPPPCAFYLLIRFPATLSAQRLATKRKLHGLRVFVFSFLFVLFYHLGRGIHGTPF